VTRAARPLLWPLVPVYQLAVALREVQLRSGMRPVQRLRWPVVSIGNLSTGGSGKTPLTIALAKALAACGLHVDVLSRGYGRRSALPLLVDVGGTTETFGDEPLVIAREACIPVYVAAARYEAGLMAETEGAEKQGAREQGSETTSQQVSKSASQRASIHLLDDGFQHRQLHRDVDILLLSRSDLNDHLLPAGNLREALRAAERADVIAIPADDPELEAEIRSRGWQAAIWRLRRRMEVPRVEGTAAAFCGIAQPEQFFAGIEAAGVTVAARIPFADHHRYSQSDLKRAVTEAQKAGAAALLTTEKDRVRLGALAATLSASLPLQTVALRIEIEDEAVVVGRLRKNLGL